VIGERLSRLVIEKGEKKGFRGDTKKKSTLGHLNKKSVNTARLRKCPKEERLARHLGVYSDCRRTVKGGCSGTKEDFAHEKGGWIPGPGGLKTAAGRNASLQRGGSAESLLISCRSIPPLSNRSTIDI